FGCSGPSLLHFLHPEMRSKPPNYRSVTSVPAPSLYTLPRHGTCIVLYNVVVCRFGDGEGRVQREARMNGRRYLAALAVVVTLCVGITIGTLLSRGVRAARPFGGAPDAKPLPVPSPAELSNSFAKIAEAVEPAVVNINTESTVRVSRRKFSSPDEAPFDDFFDRLFRPDGPQGDFRQQSLGSGVILDKSGYILTNYHVIMR